MARVGGEGGQPPCLGHCSENWPPLSIQRGYRSASLPHVAVSRTVAHSPSFSWAAPGAPLPAERRLGSDLASAGDTAQAADCMRICC